MRYQAIIFDLDGTLLNTLPDLHVIVNKTLAAFGFPERTLEEVRMCVGYGGETMIRKAVPEEALISDEAWAEILKTLWSNYLQYQNRLTCYYDGIEEMLRALRAAGVKTAIVSNKNDPALQDVMKLYFVGLIDFGTGVKQGMAVKPAPDGGLLALETLHMDAKDCLYVGDSETDVESGNNLGMETLSVTWGLRSVEFLKEHGAKHFADTPEEVVRIALGETELPCVN